MVKSGSFKVSPGSTLGRIGSGVGKGLAEQLPKEIERGRLAQGLEQFNKSSANLSPLEQASKLFSIPGLTPQMVQVLPELLKQQNLRQSFANREKGQREIQGEQQLTPEESSLQTKEFFQPTSLGSQGNAPTQFQGQQTVRPEEQGQPQIQENNPLRQEAVPRKTWSPQRYEQEIGRVWEDNPNLTLQEAIGLAQANEQRYLNEPESIRKQDDYFREQQDRVDDAFQKQLETKLQKKGEEVFKDITGESLNNLRRSMYRDLRTNPDMTIEDVANKWSTKALDLGKAKSQIDKLANNDFIDKLTKGTKRREQLETYQKIFKETGDSEEYYNTLIDKFDMSPQGAASIAFPLSTSVSKYISGIKGNEKSDSIAKAPIRARKYASDLENLINRDDSILSIARDLRNKDPYFDERSFFNELRQNIDNFSPRQKREIAEGESNLFKTWGDILIQPWGSK